MWKNCKVKKSRDLGLNNLFDEWVWVALRKFKRRLPFASNLKD